MLITSLTLENYRVFKQVELDLPEAVIGIIGPNGAGKTTLIEAVAWALYGTIAARTGKDDIKAANSDNAESCRVVLRFMLHDQEYVIERKLIGKSNRAEVELRDSSGKLLAVSVNDVQAAVAKLLGLDFRGFLTSYLARQQELNALSDLVPSKRREHLAGMLGVDRLDRALVDLRAEIKANASEIELLGDHLDKREQLAADLTQFDRRLVELEKAASEAAGARSRTREQLDKLVEQTRKGQRAEAKCSELTVALKGARSTEKSLQERQLRLEHEKQSLTEATTEIEQLTATLVRLPVVQKSVAALTQRQAEERLRTELTRRQIDFNKQIAALEKSADQLAAERKQIESDLTAIPLDLDSQRRQTNAELDQARERYSDQQAETKQAAAEIKRLESRLQDMSTVGVEAVCDRCGRAFGDDLESIREHFESELSLVRKQAADGEVKLAAMKTKGERLKQSLADLDKQAARADQLKRDREAIAKQVADFEKRIEQDKRQLTEVTEKLSGFAAKSFDPDDLKKHQGELAALEAARERRASLTGQLKRREPVEREMGETIEAQKSEAARIAELEEQLLSISFDPDAFRQTQRELQQAEQEYEAAGRTEAEAVRERDVAKREREVKQEQLEAYAETEARLKACRDTAWHDERVKSLLTDFRKQVIASIRPTLSATAGRLMSDMTDGRYSIVELDEEYNLLMMDGGALHPIERFSGGERDLANLCLRLAISQALTQSAGIDRAAVMLDEIFGSQDETRRELIFDGLAGLTRTFPQVLLVTHIEDIKNRVGALIEVRPNGDGWSEVTLHV